MLDSQLMKIVKASQKSHHNVAEISNPKLKETFEKSLNLWETKEVKDKINTGEEPRSITFYLPQELQNHQFNKFLHPDAKQCLIDTNKENALLEMAKNTPKQETLKPAEIPKKEEIIKQVEAQRDTIVQEATTENK